MSAPSAEDRERLAALPRALAAEHGWPGGYVEQMALDYIMDDMDRAGAFLSRLLEDAAKHDIPDEQVEIGALRVGDFVLYGKDRWLVLLIAHDIRSETCRLLLAHDEVQMSTNSLLNEATIGRFRDGVQVASE